MLILLPPSEGKNQPTDGPVLELEGLAFSPGLDRPRERLVRALENLGDRPVKKAMKVMDISPGLAGDIALNAKIRSTPTAPTREVYSGVLYERLALAGLGKRASQRADRHLLISSALWGMTRATDLIPYYRLSMKPKLARIGGLGTLWREPLAKAMAGSGFDEPGEIVLDMRSGSYSSLWRPRHAQQVAVRGFTETDGQRKAISHMAKSIRGDVARVVLEAAKLPVDVDEVADLVSKAGMRVETTDGTLDVIEAG
ncbi:MAG: peroxide stress protein YaaA [Solirubrobacterales bacterium]|nr:peroxide stress protein YaaA [Solirubrobacterales bacterium]